MKKTTDLAKDLMLMLQKYDAEIQELIEKRNRFKELVLLEDGTLNLHDVEVKTKVKMTKAAKEATIATGEKADKITKVKIEKPQQFRRFGKLDKIINNTGIAVDTADFRRHLEKVGFITVIENSSGKKIKAPAEGASDYMFLGTGYVIQYYEDSFKRLLTDTGYQQ